MHYIRERVQTEDAFGPGDLRRDFPVGSARRLLGRYGDAALDVRVVGYCETVVDTSRWRGVRVAPVAGGKELRLDGDDLARLVRPEDEVGEYRFRAVPEIQAVAVERRAYPGGWEVDSLYYQPPTLAANRFYRAEAYRVREQVGDRQRVSLMDLHRRALATARASIADTLLWDFSPAAEVVLNRDAYAQFARRGLDRAEFRRLAKQVFPPRATVA